jgi:hypothetical protein
LEILKQSWFYNPPRKILSDPQNITTTSVSEAKSIIQGDHLANYLLFKNKLAASDITNDMPIIYLNGLKVTILSPDVMSLKALRDKYPAESTKPFERHELDLISEAKAAPQFDYHIPINDFNLENWKEDDSIENGSSISVITEYNNKKVLWLADAHPKIIATALKHLGYSKENKLACEWVKVTHHGSSGNNSDELYDMISCKNYLISSNGENRHCLPTKECIARILRNKQRPIDSNYKLYFTYQNEVLQSMFKVDGEKIFEEFKFEVYFPFEKSKMIEA